MPRFVFILAFLFMYLLPVATIAAPNAVALAREDRIQLADGLFQRGQFTAAADEYTALLADGVTTNRDDILFRLGECQRRAGDATRARETFRRLMTECPTSRHVYAVKLQYAIALLDDVKPEQFTIAADAFASLAKTDAAPENVRAAAWYHLGDVRERQKRTADACTAYETLVARFPSSDYATYGIFRHAGLLARSTVPEDTTRALILYLDLAYKATDARIAEEAFFAAAQLAQSAGRHAQAVQLYHALRTRFPDSARARESILPAAWAEFNAGRYAESAAMLAPLADTLTAPTREEALYLRANALAKLGERDLATAQYDTLLAAFPTGTHATRAWYERVLLLYRSGKSQAVLDAVAARAELPDTCAAQVYWIAGDAAVTLTNYVRAVQYNRAVAERYPTCEFAKDAMYRLGWLFEKQNALEDAALWYTKTADMFPKSPLAAQAWYAAGACHARNGRRDDALRDWTKLLATYPDSPLAAETAYQKAMEILRGGELKRAATELDAYLKRYPADARHAEILYWRGIVHRRMDEFPEAERCFRAALAAASNDAIARETRLELGILLQKKGASAEAAATLGPLLETSAVATLSDERLAWLAETQLTEKKYAETLRATDVLLKRQPAPAWRQIASSLAGRAHEARGERDAAIAAYRSALANDANTAAGAEAALRVGKLMAAAGDYVAAAADLSDAVRRASDPKLLTIRAQAYVALAANEEARGDKNAALKYHTCVGILFDDPVLVPPSLARAAALLDALGRPTEAAEYRTELKTRYPDWKPLP